LLDKFTLQERRIPKSFSKSAPIQCSDVSMKGDAIEFNRDGDFAPADILEGTSLRRAYTAKAATKAPNASMATAMKSMFGQENRMDPEAAVGTWAPLAAELRFCEVAKAISQPTPAKPCLQKQRPCLHRPLLLQSRTHRGRPLRGLLQAGPSKESSQKH